MGTAGNTAEPVTAEPDGPEPPVGFLPPVVLTGLVVGIGLIVVAAIALRALRAGVEWHYVQATTWTPFLTFAWLAVLYVVVVIAVGRLSARHEALAVAAGLATGVAAQLVILRLSRRPLDALMARNTFNEAAQRDGARDLLRYFRTVAPQMPLHVRGNMPGKVLLFEVLRRLTTSPQTLAYLVFGLAALGGVLLYVFTRLLFGRPVIAVYAMALFFVVPARSSYITSPSVITPVVGLALLVVVLWYLRTGAAPVLLLVGVAVYVTVLWEPSPLALGGIAALLVARHVVTGASPRLPALPFVSLPLAGFVAADVAMRVATGFDMFGALGWVAQDARHFNDVYRPGYAGWLLPNLREFSVNAGYAVVLLVAVVAVTTVGRLVAAPGAWRRVMGDPAAVLGTGVVATVLAVDLAGFNRGEVSRLWMYLAVLFLPVAAATCVERLPRWSLPAILALTLLQSVLTVRLVGFDYADIFDMAVNVPMLHQWTGFVDAAALLVLGVVVAAAVRYLVWLRRGAAQPTRAD